MQAPRTGPTTTPNTTLTPTTKPIEAHMQVTGHWWVLKPIPSSLLPMSPWDFPCRFSLFQDKNFHPLVINFAPNSMRGLKISFHVYYMHICKLNIVFPTLGMLPQGCVDPQIPEYGQTNPKSTSSCTCQHHLNVGQETSRLS